MTLNDGDASANIPLKQYAIYIQDDWRATDRLTINGGLRWDYITGLPVRSVAEPELRQGAERRRRRAAGRHQGPGERRARAAEDKDNFQPRIGFAYDITGNGRNVLRGGWGIYMDMGYTNSNALFAASDATGRGFGAVLSVRQSERAFAIRTAASTASGSRPRTSRARTRQWSAHFPLFGQWTDPRLEMPYTRQTSLGWSHELMANTVMTMDFVRADGRDLNVRPRINMRDQQCGRFAARWRS